MEGQGTTAIIYGAESFVAEKLGKRLKEQGIRVVRGDYEEIPENAIYIFDFVGKEEEWRGINQRQKLVVIEINKREKAAEWEDKLRKTEINWRIVVGENVYGEGMESEGFLGRAFWLAAKNKNLVLPNIKESFRVLAADDLVEAILRSCFFSGTYGKNIIIGGREVNAKIVAEALVDEAKMTKTQVVQEERNRNELELGSEKEIEESRKLLRWEAEISFKEGVKEVVQDFVARVDLENRSRKSNPVKSTYYKPEIKREKVERRYEIEIEEEENQAIKADKLASSLVEEKETRNEKQETGIEKTEKKEEFNIENLWKKVENKVENQAIKADKSASSLVEEKKEEGEKKRSYWKWGLSGLIGLIVLFGVIEIIKIARIPGRIKETAGMVEAGKYAEAKKEIEKLKTGNQGYLAIWGGKKVGELVRAEGEVVDLLGISLNLAENGEKIAGGIFEGKEVEMSEEVGKVEVGLDEAIAKMGILEGRLSGQYNWLPGRFREIVQEKKRELELKKDKAVKAREIMPVLPELLGLDGKKREYLVLFQNENELRPTGGFIGSYAILSFEDGKWQGLEIKDVYEADGQLKGHVEPPEEIKKYLGEAGWFMRDANWQASFPLAAKDLQWFLEKETGRKVNGVIGINLAAVKAILGVVGEIYVPDFEEKINQSNLYEQAEYYSENKFFAGSGQKASFLGAVGKQLMEEIRSAKGKKSEELLLATIDLLEENEIEVALNENGAAKTMARAGWDGATYEGKCNPTNSTTKGQACVADYLYIVEANFGVNKANYFIYRNIEREVEISENGIENTVKINYENTAKSNNWPGGDYKNYMRIYVPAEAELREVNWSENGSGVKKVIGNGEMKISQMGSKKEIGFLIQVPITKKINVEVKYVEKVDLGTVDKFSYLSYIQKQSGYGDTGMVTLISIPEGWQINGVEPAASVVGGKLLFNQKLDRDIKMGVEISK